MPSRWQEAEVQSWTVPEFEQFQAKEDHCPAMARVRFRQLDGQAIAVRRKPIADVQLMKSP
eukprot:10883771-Alexandrium_andersonii.AAC.1